MPAWRCWQRCPAPCGRCRRRRSGPRSRVCSAAGAAGAAAALARRALLALPLAAAAAAAAARRCRPRAASTCSPPMSGRARAVLRAHPRPPAASSTPARSTRARATPASACCCRCCARAASAASTCWCSATATSTTSAAPRPLLAALPVGALLELARAGASAARRWRRAHIALRGRPALGLGRRAIRGAAPGRPTTTRAASSRTRCRACCASPAAAAACCSPATSSATRRRALVAAHGERPAQRRADRAAPRQQDLVERRPSSTRCGRASPWSRPATATASAIRRPRCWRATASAASRVVASPACGAWHWRGRRRRRRRACERDAARRYWQQPRTPERSAGATTNIPAIRGASAPTRPRRARRTRPALTADAARPSAARGTEMGEALKSCYPVAQALSRQRETGR